MQIEEEYSVVVFFCVYDCNGFFLGSLYAHLYIYKYAFK